MDYSGLYNCWLNTAQMDVSKVMGVPPSFHPFIDGFSLPNQAFLDTTIPGTPQMGVKHSSNWRIRSEEEVVSRLCATIHFSVWERVLRNISMRSRPWFMRTTSRGL